MTPPRGMVILLAMIVLLQPAFGEDAQVTTWRQQATAGDPLAETALGRAYSYGQNGVAVDHLQALSWLQKAAAQNNAAAASEIGWLYQAGRGIPPDPAKAFEWTKKGAEGGDAYGEMKLGYCYEGGLGVPKDETQAIAWFSKSARQGNDEAITKLGVAFETGVGMQKDPKLAFTYYLRAAYGNWGWAQYNVGRCYYGGIFVPRDPVESYRWFVLAAKKGYDVPAEVQMLTYFSTALMPAQFGDAQALIKNWDKEQSGDWQSPALVVSFANGQPATIPLQDLYNELLVIATVNGHPNLKFSVDSGCSASFIDSKTASEIGMVSGPLYRPMGGIGPDLLLAPQVDHVDLELPGIRFSEATLCELSTSEWDGPMGLHTDGILGGDLLKHTVVHIDYTHRTIEFLDPALFKATGQPGLALPLISHGSFIYVNGTVTNNGASSPSTPIMLDTGSTSSIDLNRYFVGTNLKLGLKGGSPHLAHGIGGTLPTSTVKILNLKLGDLLIANPSAELASFNQGVPSNAIGNEILRRFDVIIDYPDGKVFLTPNAAFGNPFIYTNSGLEVKATGPDLKTYVVQDIIPGTAGATAGFQIGDILTQFDDIPLSNRSMSQTHVLFRAGGKHRVIVTRNGQPVVLDYIRNDITVSKPGG